jgi:hypothetical protein
LSAGFGAATRGRLVTFGVTDACMEVTSPWSSIERLILLAAEGHGDQFADPDLRLFGVSMARVGTRIPRFHAVRDQRAYQTKVPTDSAGNAVWKTFP